jgi:hypothetical protein
MVYDKIKGISIGISTLISLFAYVIGVWFVHKYFNIHFLIYNHEVTEILHIVLVGLFMCIMINQYRLKQTNEFVTFGYWALLVLLTGATMLAYIKLYADKLAVTDFLYYTKIFTIEVKYTMEFKKEFIESYLQVLVNMTDLSSKSQQAVLDISKDYIHTLLHYDNIRVIKEKIPALIHLMLDGLTASSFNKGASNHSIIFTLANKLRFVIPIVCICSFTVVYSGLALNTVLFSSLKRLIYDNMLSKGITLTMTPFEIDQLLTRFAELAIDQYNKPILIARIILYLIPFLPEGVIKTIISIFPFPFKE